MTKFTLKLAGGKRGLLVNSVNLCQHNNSASLSYTAQSEKSLAQNLRLTVPCGGGHKRHRRHLTRAERVR